jgi:hypothetical protein
MTTEDTGVLDLSFGTAPRLEMEDRIARREGWANCGRG